MLSSHIIHGNSKSGKTKRVLFNKNLLLFSNNSLFRLRYQWFHQFYYAVIYKFPPYNIPFETNNTPRIRGLVGSMFANIVNSFNMTYELSYPSDGDYGMIYPNLTSKGQLKMLQDDKADVALGPFTTNYLMHLAFHPTPNLYYSSLTILSGMTKAYTNTPIALTAVFDPPTWILLTMFSFAIFVVLCGHYYLHHKRHINATATVEQAFTVLEILLQEGGRTHLKQPLQRALGFIFIVGTFVLASSFANQGKAMLIIQAPTTRYDTLQQILNKKDLLIYYPSNSQIQQFLEEIGGENGKRLRARMKKAGGIPNGHWYNSQVQNDLITEKAVLLLDIDSQMSHVSEWCLDFQKTHRYYYIGTEPLRAMSVNLCFSKALPKDFLNAFDQKVLWSLAYDVKFLQTFELFPGHFHCVPGNTNRQADQLDSLNFDSVSYVFKLFVVMLAMSIVVFCLEVLYNKVHLCYC